jgi:hypothetical protein
VITNTILSFLSAPFAARKKTTDFYLLRKKNAENCLLQNGTKERSDLFLEMNQQVKSQIRLPVHRLKNSFFIIHR